MTTTDSPVASYFQQAAHYTPDANGEVKWIVIHCIATKESDTAVRDNLNYYSGSDSVKASAHYFVDNHDCGQSVREKDKAWHCGYNTGSIGIEFSGLIEQTREQWLDAFGVPMLDRGAFLIADLCKRHGVPVRWLTNDQLANNEKGLATHAQMSEVFKKSDHTDPGPNFPKDYLLALVQRYSAPVAPAKPAPAPSKPSSAGSPKASTPTPAYPNLAVDGVLGPVTIKALQTALHTFVDGQWGPGTTKALQTYLNGKHLGANLLVDGDFGPATKKRLQTYLHTTVDGDFGPVSVKALQTRLNNHTF